MRRDPDRPCNVGVRRNVAPAAVKRKRAGATQAIVSRASDDQSWIPAGVGSDNEWHIGEFNGDGKADIFRCLAG